MTPTQREVWSRMPEEARNRARAAAEWIGDIGSLVDLWEAAERYEAALTAGKSWALRAEQEKADGGSDQADLDKALAVACDEGRYGPEAQKLARSVISDNQFAETEAVLREVRRAVYIERNCQAKYLSLGQRCVCTYCDKRGRQ